MIATQQFSKEEFTELCESLSNSAYQGCGQSDILFTRRFSKSIEQELNQIPEEHLEEALVIAQQYGYMTEEEMAIDEDDGFCSHGFDPDCCPCGCGDID